MDTIADSSAAAFVGPIRAAFGPLPRQSASGAVVFLAPPPRLLAANPLVVFVTTLYHLAISERPRWPTGPPGALVTQGVWGVGFLLVRWYRRAGQKPRAVPATGAITEVGPIAATAAILLWLRAAALAVPPGAGRAAAGGAGQRDGDTGDA